MLIAVIDSGINAEHPHVAGVVDGIAIAADGSLHTDWVDRVGHGTAVAATIHEKAPGAELIAVRVFDRSLETSAAVLARAIDWAVERGAQFINLSLGTADEAQAPLLAAAVQRAVGRGVQLVAAAEHEGQLRYPGSLPGAIGVRLDWECPRDEIRPAPGPPGEVRYLASGYPRPIPGVPPERNLKGIGLAVANVTGVLAQAAAGATPPAP